MQYNTIMVNITDLLQPLLYVLQINLPLFLVQCRTACQKTCVTHVFCFPSQRSIQNLPPVVTCVGMGCEIYTFLKDIYNTMEHYSAGLNNFEYESKKCKIFQPTARLIQKIKTRCCHRRCPWCYEAVPSAAQQMGTSHVCAAASSSNGWFTNM